MAALLAAAMACGAWVPPPDDAGHVAVSLLSEQASVQPGRPFRVGVRMIMRGGWHTYWRNPGDSGLPLRIHWDLPPGFSAGSIGWPAPERIPGNGLMSYGYTGATLLPVEITPPGRIDSDSVTIAGRFDWLECADVCVPRGATLSLRLPVRAEPPRPGPAAPLFAAARSRIPAPAAGWTFTAEAGPRAISLRFEPPHGLALRGGYLFVDRPLVADYAAPQGFERVAGGYRLTVTPTTNAQGPLRRLTGVLVVRGRSGANPAVLVDVPVARGDPSPAPTAPAGRRPAAPAWPIVLAVLGLGVAGVSLGVIRQGRRKVHPPREPKG